MMCARPIARLAIALSAWGLLASPALALEGRAPMARTPLCEGPAYAKAIALDLAGRFEAALAAYEEAARAGGPGKDRARYHVELSRGVLKNIAKLRLAPADGRTHFSLGVDAGNKVTALVREVGLVPRAYYALSERSLREAMRRLPELADPTICLAGLYADAGERGRARATIELVKGRQLRPPEIYNLACYHHSIGDYDRALLELAKVINPYYRQWIGKSDDFYRLKDDPRLERLLRITRRR